MVKRDKPRKGKVHSTNNQMTVSGGGVYTAEKTYTHRYPTTVIEVPDIVQKGRQHPAQKPIGLMEYLIKTYTDEGQVVLDFAMGIGTTGLAARKLGRKFVGIEIDQKFFDLARENLQPQKETDNA